MGAGSLVFFLVHRLPDKRRTTYHTEIFVAELVVLKGWLSSLRKKLMNFKGGRESEMDIW